MKKTKIFKKTLVGVTAICLTAVCCLESGIGTIIGNQVYGAEEEEIEQTEDINVDLEKDNEISKSEEPLEIDSQEKDQQSRSLSPSPVTKDEKKDNTTENSEVNPSQFKKDVGEVEGKLIATIDEKTGDLIITGEKNATISKDKLHNAIKEAKNYKPEKNDKKLIIKTDVSFPEDSENLFYFERAEADSYNGNTFGLVFEGKINTSKVYNFNSAFNDCTILKGDFSDWDTSNVESMYAIFHRTRIEKLDLSKWDVSKVESLENAFSLCTAKEINVNNWNLDSLGKDYSECISHIFGNIKNASVDISNWTGEYLYKVGGMGSFYNSNIKYLDTTLFGELDIFPKNSTYTIKVTGKNINNKDSSSIALRAGVHYVYECDNETNSCKLSHGLIYEKDMDYNIDGVSHPVSTNHDSNFYKFDDDKKYIISAVKPEPMVFNTFKNNKFDMGSKNLAKSLDKKEKPKYDDFKSFEVKEIKNINSQYLENLSAKERKEANKVIKKFITDFSNNKTLKIPAVGKYEIEAKVSFNGDEAVPMSFVINSNPVPVPKEITIKKGTKLDSKILSGAFDNLPEGVGIEKFTEIDTNILGRHTVKAKLSGIDNEIEITVNVEAQETVVNSKDIKTGDESKFAIVGITLLSAIIALFLAVKRKAVK